MKTAKLILLCLSGMLAMQPGGKGLIFNAPLTGYKKESLKKGKTRIDFKTGNEEDKYEYSLTIYSDGSANIHIQPMNKQAISYSGELDVKE